MLAISALDVTHKEVPIRLHHALEPGHDKNDDDLGLTAAAIASDADDEKDISFEDKLHPVTESIEDKQDIVENTVESVVGGSAYDSNDCSGLCDRVAGAMGLIEFKGGLKKDCLEKCEKCGKETSPKKQQSCMRMAMDEPETGDDEVSRAEEKNASLMSIKSEADALEMLKNSGAIQKKNEEPGAR